MIEIKKKIEKSGLISPEWYLNKYQDVRILGMNPLDHYLTYGWLMNRDPSIRFSTEQYLEHNKDVKESNMNPLVHYVEYGKKEGREKFESLNFQVATRPPTKANQKQSVLVHSHNLRWQGAQNSLFEIAKGIKRRKKYDVMLTASSTGELIDAYKEQDIEFLPHPFPSRGVGHAKEMEKYIAKLATHYRSTGASLIHANTLQNYFSVLAAKEAELPILLNVRESENPLTYFEYLPDYLIEKAFDCVSTADAVVFVAEATMKIWAEHFPGSNFHLIRNGVDVNRLLLQVYGLDKEYSRKYLRLSENNVVVLNVGTFCERKNQLELLRAYELILQENIHNIEIILVGANNSKYSEQVSQYQHKLNGMGGHIRVIRETSGQRGLKQLAIYYQAADIFNLCSLVESYPRVVVEAFAFGLPVISSVCFGTVEQITHGQNGFLYDSGDTEDLKNSILKISEDHRLREDMAKEARKRLRVMSSYGTMLEAYEQIYDELLKRKINEEAT